MGWFEGSNKYKLMPIELSELNTIRLNFMLKRQGLLEEYESLIVKQKTLSSNDIVREYFKVRNNMRELDMHFRKYEHYFKDGRRRTLRKVNAEFEAKQEMLDIVHGVKSEVASDISYNITYKNNQLTKSTIKPKGEALS